MYLLKLFQMCFPLAPSFDVAETTQGSPVCFDLVADALISRESLSDAQKTDPTLEKCCVSDENNLSLSPQQFY